MEPEAPPEVPPWLSSPPLFPLPEQGDLALFLYKTLQALNLRTKGSDLRTKGPDLRTRRKSILQVAFYRTRIEFGKQFSTNNSAIALGEYIWILLGKPDTDKDDIKRACSTQAEHGERYDKLMRKVSRSDLPLVYDVKDYA